MYVSVSSVSIITATCSIDNIVYIISNLILYVEGLLVYGLKECNI